jgi:hypothetical protein
MTTLAVETTSGRCTVVTGVGETCGNHAAFKLLGRNGETLYECLGHFTEAGVRIVATVVLPRTVTGVTIGA